MSTPKPTVSTQIIPYLFYRDVPAALDWLARAFGFVEEMRHATPGGMHAQMTLYGQRIMMGQGSKEWGMLIRQLTPSCAVSPRRVSPNTARSLDFCRQNPTFAAENTNS